MAGRPWLDGAIRGHYATDGLLAVLAAIRLAGHDVTDNVVKGRAARLGISRIGPPIRSAGLNDGRPRDWHGRFLSMHDDGFLPSPGLIRAGCDAIRKRKHEELYNE